MDTSLVRGSIWMIALRWSVRGIGLVSTVILARLLTPTDFGIVAMGSLVAGLLAVFTELGTWQLLIRKKGPLRSHYDTAWTIGLIQSIFLAAILFVFAPFAALYFDEPRVTEVIRWLSLSSVISGFKNIGVINFRKELDFNKDFRFELLLKISAFVATVSLAFYLKTYWALVFGVISGRVAEVIWSYIMHPYRPRLSLAEWREFVSFSLWVAPAGIANFFNQKSDVFIVGYVANTAQMGVYNVASELSRMATSGIVVPMWRALFPNYATLADKPERLAEAFLNTVRTTSVICISCGVGVAVVAEDLVFLILGDQWASAVPLVRWLAIFGLLASLSFVLSSHIFIVTGKERYMFMLNWLRLLIFAPSVAIAGYTGGVEAVAIATVVSTASFLFIAMFCVQVAVPIRPHEIMLTMVRPLISSAVMVLVIAQIDFSTGEHAADLLANVILGAAVFSVTLLALWFVSGRPAGPEKYCLDYISERFANSSVPR